MEPSEEDEGFDEPFSLDHASYWGSATPSIYEFPEENGRTYHAYGAGKYFVPNDSKEKTRLDLIDHSLDLMFEGKLYFAPVKNPQLILDVGTGTGQWAINVGEMTPSAAVIGIDLSPIQPAWIPGNVEFRIDDLTKEWIYDHPLDLVHSRIMAGIGITDWPSYLARAYKALRPGGYIEAQEFDIYARSDDSSFPPSSPVLKWHSLIRDGFLRGGCDMHVTAPLLKSYFQSAGFINVTTHEFKWPLSPWPEDPRLKEAGAYAMLSMIGEAEGDIEGLSMGVFTKFLGWGVEELEAFLKKVKREWRRSGVHGYWPLVVVYGQKPFGAEQDQNNEYLN